MLFSSQHSFVLEPNVTLWTLLCQSQGPQSCGHSASRFPCASCFSQLPAPLSGLAPSLTGPSGEVSWILWQFKATLPSPISIKCFPAYRPLSWWSLYSTAPWHAWIIYDILKSQRHVYSLPRLLSRAGKDLSIRFSFFLCSPNTTVQCTKGSLCKETRPFPPPRLSVEGDFPEETLSWGSH